jgi:hypothetical protein
MLSIFQNILDNLTLYEAFYVNMCETICYTKNEILQKNKNLNSVHLTLWNYGNNLGELWWAMISNKLMGMGCDM